MILRFFIEVNGKLVSTSKINELNCNLNDKDWYYLRGSIEVTQEGSDKAYISKEDTTDIIPFAYEFFSLFILLNMIKDLATELPHVLTVKLCSRSVLYHPIVGYITAQNMNDVYLETVFNYHDGSFQSVVTENENFFNNFKDSFYDFDKAIRALFPDTTIPMLDEIAKIMSENM